MVWQCTKELRLNKFASATCLYYNIIGSNMPQKTTAGYVSDAVYII